MGIPDDKCNACQTVLDSLQRGINDGKTLAKTIKNALETDNTVNKAGLDVPKYGGKEDFAQFDPPWIPTGA